MPELSRFYGIVIKMYFGDHDPPHFHAEYAEDRAVITSKRSPFSVDAFNSFKPNALRYTNHMADMAFHVVASATHVGLTQALAGQNGIRNDRSR